MVWFGKSPLKATFGPRLVCSDSKLLRAFPSRRPSGWAEPHPWPHFPICVGWNHSRSPTNDRSRIRRLPLLGNPPRPSPTRPQRHCSWAAALAQLSGPARPSRGHWNYRITLEITSYGLVKPDNVSEEVVKGPLMVNGGEVEGPLLLGGAYPPADCSTDLIVNHLGPSTTGPKKASRGFSGTLHTWGTYPDRP